MPRTLWRSMSLAMLLFISLLMLATCSGPGRGLGASLYVQSVIENAQEYTGREITVDGYYVWRAGDPALSVLALGATTMGNGLDAQPLGEPIWLEGFPAEVTADLHRPGDGVYGAVRVRGQFDAGGGHGPNGAYQYQLQVDDAEAIEQVQWVEHSIDDTALGDGKVSFFDLRNSPDQYNDQTVTTQGYYFWNSVIYVLAEGVLTERDGTSPQPMGDAIWMEGFPPDESAQLNLGPNNSYVWGLVEITGRFETGGGFGKDGAYQSAFFVESATPLETK